MDGLAQREPLVQYHSWTDMILLRDQCGLGHIALEGITHIIKCFFRFGGNKKPSLEDKEHKQNVTMRLYYPTYKGKSINLRLYIWYCSSSTIFW